MITNNDLTMQLLVLLEAKVESGRIFVEELSSASVRPKGDDQPSRYPQRQGARVTTNARQPLNWIKSEQASLRSCFTASLLIDIALGTIGFAALRAWTPEGPANGDPAEWLIHAYLRPFEATAANHSSSPQPSFIHTGCVTSSLSATHSFSTSS